MAWLCSTVELPTERFLGAGGADSEGAILAGHIHDTIDVWETLQSWLDGGRGGSLWSVHAGALHADPSELAKCLEAVGRGWSLRDVRGALAPFHVGDYRPRDGAVRARLWALDAARVAAAMDLDAEALCELDARLSGADAPAAAKKFAGFKR
jgi:hypothetical protein